MPKRKLFELEPEPLSLTELHKALSELLFDDASCLVMSYWFEGDFGPVLNSSDDVKLARRCELKSLDARKKNPKQTHMEMHASGDWTYLEDFPLCAECVDRVKTWTRKALVAISWTDYALLERAAAKTQLVTDYHVACKLKAPKEFFYKHLGEHIGARELVTVANVSDSALEAYSPGEMDDATRLRLASNLLEVMSNVESTPRVLAWLYQGLEIPWKQLNAFGDSKAMQSDLERDPRRYKRAGVKFTDVRHILRGDLNLEVIKTFMCATVMSHLRKHIVWLFEYDRDKAAEIALLPEMFSNEIDIKVSDFVRIQAMLSVIEDKAIPMHPNVQAKILNCYPTKHALRVIDPSKLPSDALAKLNNTAIPLVLTKFKPSHGKLVSILRHGGWYWLNHVELDSWDKSLDKHLKYCPHSVLEDVFVDNYLLATTVLSVCPTLFRWSVETIRRLKACGVTTRMLLRSFLCYKHLDELGEIDPADLANSAMLDWMISNEHPSAAWALRKLGWGLGMTPVVPAPEKLKHHVGVYRV